MEAAFRYAGVHEDEFEPYPAEKQVNCIELLESLLVRTAVDGQFKLHARAGYGARELTDAADSSGKQSRRRELEQVLLIDF